MKGRSRPGLAVVPLLGLAILTLQAAALPAQSATATRSAVAGPETGPARSDQTGGTPAAARLSELLDVLREWRPDSVVAYIQRAYEPGFRDDFPMEVHVGFLGEIAELTRPIRLHHIEAGGDDGSRGAGLTATAVLHAPLVDVWRQLTIEVEADPPHRIAGLRPLRAATPPDDAPAPRGGDSPSALDRYARGLADADLFSGGVLVARGDEVVLREAYGLASRELAVPNSPDTRFILGSINKMFTAVGILQLAERGALSLDDRVSDHLPGVLPDSVAERVRLRHLLSHTSGLGDFLFTPEMWDVNRARYRTIDDYLPLLADDTLAFEPGTAWRYSNTAYLVLGAIVEAASGESYYDYIRRSVLEPAGMTHTGWPELDRVPRNVASTYERVFHGGEPGFRSDRYDQVVKGTPAGGGFATLDDMHRFATALMDSRLLSPETLGEMLSPKPDVESPRYGFGAQIFGDGWVGHTGGGPGTADYFGFRPETGEVVVVLGTQTGQSSPVAERARELARRR